MEISRREFLRASGAGVGGIFCLGLLNPSTAIPDNLSSLARPSSEKAILYDSVQCVGCHFCEAVCKKENELEEKMTADDKLSPNTWLKIVKTKPRREEEEAELSQLYPELSQLYPELSQLYPDSRWFFRDCMRQACMHCTDATCVKVCPTQALYHHELGFVGYDKDLCSGCGFCVDFCPFNVPRC